jgi:hypothetical protein
LLPDCAIVGGPFAVDAGVVCVEIDITAYDTSCREDSDCIEITAGDLYSGGCGRVCGGSAVNATEQARYTAAVSLVLSRSADATDASCGCPTYGLPTCEAGQCVVCYENAEGGAPPFRRSHSFPHNRAWRRLPWTQLQRPIGKGGKAEGWICFGRRGP